jgi:alanine racemase
MTIDEQTRGHRPTWAEISLSNIAWNARLVGEQTGAAVMAMVKADAYGHGAVPVAKYLEEHKAADWFGVATVEEGVELRRAGVTRPILVMSGFWTRQEVELLEFNLTATIQNLESLRALDRAAREAGKTAPVHLEIDTGIGRMGILPDALPAFLEGLSTAKNLHLDGLMTHFSSADMPERADFTESQIARHATAWDAVTAAGFAPKWRHLANSAGTHAFPASFGNMVRIGGMLYGIAGDIIRPDVQMMAARPGLALRSQIILLKTVPPGTPLGYGGTFVAKRETRVATLPIGYADGYLRRHSNNGKAIVKGNFAPVVGRVSMDLTMLDVTDVPGVELGDLATLIGEQDGLTIPAEEYAASIGTIALEAATTISRRVPRKYR